MPRTRRLTLLFVLVALSLGCATAVLLWQWKVPGLVRRRLEEITRHRVTIGGVSLNHRLEIVARDVRVSGTPPFESQILARAERVIVHLGGSGGLWSPSEVVLDGLDLEYLATAVGDNLHAPNPRATRAPLPTMGNSAPAGIPSIVARNVHLHGSIALAHAPRIEFRVPQAEFERRLDGTVQATLHRVVVDAEGWGSLRALALSGEYDRHRLLIASGGSVAVEVPGGGTLLDNLVIAGIFSGTRADVEIHGRDTSAKSVLLALRWQPGAVEATMDADEVPLRALGAVATKRAIGVEHAKASLHASLALDGVRADFEVRGKVRGVDLLHPAIDSTPWRDQAGSLALRGSANLASGRIDITDGELTAFSAPLSLTGWMDIEQAPRGSLVLSTPAHAPLSCSALLIGQPAPVREALSGLELDGKLGFKVAVAFDASAWEDLSLDVDVRPLCQVKREANVLANLLPILRTATANTSAPTKLPLGSQHPDFVPLARMPPHLTAAFLTSEDSKFFHHQGFDLDMIRHALAQDLENRSFDRGASTITQQLAKNLFLTHRRTLARKLEEAVLTWRLHKLLSKDRLLELYLNVIELGPGILGVKQAARVYFGKDVADLTPLESAHLAALTPNPHVLARRFRDGEVDEGWQQRLYDLLGMMKRRGRLSSAELAQARASKLVLRDLSHDLPTRDAH